MTRQIAPLLALVLSVVVIIAGAALYTTALGIREHFPGRPVHPQQNYPDRISPREADGLVLVIVQGLALTPTSQPLLEDLARRQKGSLLIARAAEPSGHRTGSAMILSGAGTPATGVPHRAKPLAVDHLFAAAQRVGENTLVVGSPGSRARFPQARTIIERAEPSENSEAQATSLSSESIRYDRELTALFLREWNARRPILGVLHLKAPAVYARESGTIKDLNYLSSVEQTIRTLETIPNNLDLKRVAFVVATAHGATDTLPGAGWGGSEASTTQVPLILAGRGFRSNGRPRLALVSNQDIAPTTATILGLPIPAHNEGRILFSWLDLPGATAGSAAGRLQTQLANLDAGDPYNAKRMTGVSTRSSVALILVALTLILFRPTFSQRRDGWRNLGSLLAYELLFFLLYVALFETASLSSIPPAAGNHTLYVTLLSFFALFAVLVCVPFFDRSEVTLQGRYQRMYRISGVLLCAIILKAGLAYALIGGDQYLPPPWAIFAGYVFGIQLATAGVATLLAACLRLRSLLPAQ